MKLSELLTTVFQENATGGNLGNMKIALLLGILPSYINLILGGVLIWVSINSEAITWLHSQLIINPHFGPAVTKDQTQQLLCKFLKAGVFEDVRGIETKVEHFKENSGLYRSVKYFV